MERVKDEKKERMIDYFRIGTDASRITWSHAVNSKQKLIEAISGEFMFLEADIQMVSDVHSEPVMAHPPVIHSDLTFSQWIDLVKHHHEKGLKLDFKTESAVETCLNTLVKNGIKNPVILNADIFTGSKSPEAKFNPVDFVNKCVGLYPQAVISIGWTTVNSKILSYSWSDVYSAFKLLENYRDRIHEVTFACRAQWSIKSLFKLLWLIKYTRGSLTIWSHSTDDLTSLESLLLFRKYFPDSDVFYDLPDEQDSYFRKYSNDKQNLNKILNNSNDELVKDVLKMKPFASDTWSSIKGASLSCDYSVLVTIPGDGYQSQREFKSNITDVYEIQGKFELFKVKSTNESDDFGLARVSIRSSADGTDSPGSINVYVQTNGVIKVYIGNALFQEAHIQQSTKFTYKITDTGEMNDVNIELTSFDEDMNSYKTEILVRSAHVTGQTFFIRQTLISENYAMGIDELYISDEIIDPQGRNLN